jgi:hypothetical protein
MITRKSFTRLSAAAVVVAAAAAFGAPRSARAQLDPTGGFVFDLYENGERVGQVYREGENPNEYVEHWVMFPRYVYPSSVNGVRLLVVPGADQYRSAGDFLARVPFEQGSRYARAAIFDAERIPGR